MTSFIEILDRLHQSSKNLIGRKIGTRLSLPGEFVQKSRSRLGLREI